MFGYLSARREELTEAEFLRYRAAYCGLCRTLKERHGELSRLTLNFDMCFLLLLLNSLHSPDEQSGEGTCLMHPVHKRAWFKSDVTDYAADMNIALVYLKCADDWEDDRSLLSAIERAMLKKAYEKVKAQYPRQCGAMLASLSALSQLEKSGVNDPDAAAGCFGELMAELFVLREDYWSPTLRRLGAALGRFIYIMDACIDLERDIKSRSYNPLKDICRSGSECGDMLKMLLGDCVREFERLPIIDDAAILKNILCSGLWQEFQKKYSMKKEA